LSFLFCFPLSSAFICPSFSCLSSVLTISLSFLFAAFLPTSPFFCVAATQGAYLLPPSGCHSAPTFTSASRCQPLVHKQLTLLTFCRR
jgi:hypothetical protein